jgi:hypothetical protein
LPDNDDVGRDHVRAVAANLAPVGARVRILELSGLPPKGDVSDWLNAGGGEDEWQRLAAAAPDFQPSPESVSESPPGEGPAYLSFGQYRMWPKGLWLEADDPDKPNVWLAAPFEVVVQTRDADSHSWGKLLRWRDADERVHEWAMPLKTLGGSREELWRELLDGGLRIASSTASRGRLADYLSAVQPAGRARAISRVGWHTGSSGAAAYVLPDATFYQTPRRASSRPTASPARWMIGAGRSAGNAPATRGWASPSRSLSRRHY